MVSAKASLSSLNSSSFAAATSSKGSFFPFFVLDSESCFCFFD